MIIEDAVYEILTKKRYNRDEAFLKEEIKEKIKRIIEQKAPIKLVGFWGVGQKKTANWADSTACEFLKELNNDVKKVYPHGIEFMFIFATEHGIHNGIEKETMQNYTKEIEKIFTKHGFKWIYLDTLWKKYDISFKKIDKEFEKKPKGWWEKIENAKMIEKNAKNRNLRLDPKTAAQKYFIMRGLEKQMLEKEFADCIFHAFSDAKLRNVLPHLPTLYFYARKGWSDTPWFVIN
ncbi:hypothetical protein HZC31_07020 [Candidatus Woesearchaeota archaeon]|nr:hypothetical protein [Candidatus Woesearchaeota archaeon]